MRPQAITVLPSGEGVAARLEARRFLGEVELLELAVEGLEAPLRARMRARFDAGLRPNSEVGIDVDAAEVLVFAAAAA